MSISLSPQTKIAGYCLLSDSYYRVAKATLMTLIPHELYGGTFYREVSVRGEFLKTAVFGVAELVCSVAGLVFWGVAYLVTFGKEGVNQLHEQAAYFLAANVAIGFGLVGAFHTETGYKMGAAVLVVPFQVLYAELQDRIQDLSQQAFAWISQQMGRIQQNIPFQRFIPAQYQQVMRQLGL